MKKSEMYIPELLSSNEYWGRGIVIGRNGDKMVIAYFIMGRSDNSRNRIFYMQGNDLAIAPYDADKVEDPSLIIYYPIKIADNFLIVTNGDQTDTIADCIREGRTFQYALSKRKFEPDAPHYTPRISGILDLEYGEYELSILKRIKAGKDDCARYYYQFPPIDGAGHFIHTYEANEEPLPSFEGEPWLISIDGDIDEFSGKIWHALNYDNKISLCVMYIDNDKNIETRLFNKRKGD